MDHTRHMNIFNVPRHFRVGLVGAGGIGATTALALAKMGVRHLTVWDDDVVSNENIATQLHQWQDVGALKVDGLRNTLEMFSDEIVVVGEAMRIQPDLILSGHYDLFITAVDTITVRQDIWNVLTRTDVEWFIDARMAAEKFDMFVLNMQDARARERYEQMLMGLREVDVEELPCTEKSTFFCALAAAANVGAILRNILRNEQPSERVIQYIPQFTMYRLAL